ncbi:hypothetical protein BJ508DRAFT_311593 [Ascobolus immersus RN42]|uniref:Uncharacterized protein n=1 Tax=Ascobolus immersus RN42 TaxID=1160509 RepID=A0A3N4HTP3_ASCIM|nr:hypothetical protein BJ508DRAFT_311593 [Ascobolus immersus RN42]
MRRLTPRVVRPENDDHSSTKAKPAGTSGVNITNHDEFPPLPVTKEQGELLRRYHAIVELVRIDFEEEYDGRYEFYEDGFVRSDHPGHLPTRAELDEWNEAHAYMKYPADPDDLWEDWSYLEWEEFDNAPDRKEIDMKHDCRWNCFTKQWRERKSNSSS